MAVAFSPDGKVLAGGGSDGQVRLWNAATGAPLAVIPHPQPVTSLAWDGAHLLVTGDADGYVRAWHLPVPDLMTGGPVYSIALSPAGGALAAGGTGLQVWNPATRALTASAAIPDPAPGDIVNAVAISPGGNLIATGYGDGRLQLWRPGPRLIPLGTPQPASQLPAGFTNQVEFVAFSPDGRLLASGSDDGTVRLWDISDPARPRQLSVIHDSGDAVFSVAFSPSGHVLAAASADDKVRLWNVTDPARPVQLGGALTGPTNTAYSVAFSPDGTILAVGSADRDVRLWNVSDPARPYRVGPVLTGPAGLRVLGRVQPRREHSGRGEHRRQRVAVERGPSRTSGADHHPDRAVRARLLGRVRPRRPDAGRRGLGRPGLALGHPGQQRGPRRVRDGRAAADPRRVACLRARDTLRTAVPLTAAGTTWAGVPPHPRRPMPRRFV